MTLFLKKKKIWETDLYVLKIFLLLNGFFFSYNTKLSWIRKCPGTNNVSRTVIFTPPLDDFDSSIFSFFCTVALLGTSSL